MTFKSFVLKSKEVKRLKLGDVCEIHTGISFRPKFYRDSGFPIVKVRNIQDDQIVTDNLNYCDPGNHPTAEVIKYGDVVMARNGSAGAVGINLTGKEFFFDDHIFKFIPHETVLMSRYLYHFLLSYQDEIKRLVRGLTIPEIRKSELEELMVPIPSLETQEWIVQTLDKFREIEREISLREKQYVYYRHYLIAGSHRKSSS